MVNEFFYLEHAGRGRWAVKHRITDEPAGVVTRSGDGFALYDDADHLVGTADSIEHALVELYAVA